MYHISIYYGNIFLFFHGGVARRLCHGHNGTMASPAVVMLSFYTISALTTLQWVRPSHFNRPIDFHASSLTQLFNVRCLVLPIWNTFVTFCRRQNVSCVRLLPSVSQLYEVANDSHLNRIMLMFHFSKHDNSGQTMRVNKFKCVFTKGFV